MKRIESIKNWQLKLMAVITAMLLWLFVVGSENYVYTLKDSVPLQITNLAADLTLANKLETVKVKYSFLKGQLKNVSSADFSATLDAKDLQEGTHSLKVILISKNPEIRVVAAEPAETTIDLEAITTKEIVTKLKVMGDPAQDYFVAKSALSDEKIKIKGAESVLTNISEINFLITLDGTERADFSRLISPLPAPEWNVESDSVSFDPAQIQADLQIRKKPVDETATSDGAGDSLGTTGDATLVRKTLMVQVKLPEGNIGTVKEILPANMLATFEGEKTIIDSLQASQFTMLLDLNRIEKGGLFNVVAEDIKFDPTLKVKVVDFSPAKVTVRF